MMRDRIAAERQRLVQKILADADRKPASDSRRDSDDAEPESDEQPVGNDQPYSCCWSQSP